jgi:hypothetical protein
MRLHEVHRIGPAKSMAGVSHPGELIGGRAQGARVRETVLVSVLDKIMPLAQQCAAAGSR